MIFLVHFGVNKHVSIFQRPQIEILLQLVFEKFTCAYLFQIALEIMWLPIQIYYMRLLCGACQKYFSLHKMLNHRINNQF